MPEPLQSLHVRNVAQDLTDAALRGDAAHLDNARRATWLTKPKNMPYQDFVTLVTSVPGAERSSLWRRQMVLGPTPGFGMLSPAPLALLQLLQPLVLDLEPSFAASA